MERGPLPDGGYWLVGKGGLWLGEGLKYSSCRTDARKFLSLEDCKKFTYDGRKEMGSTFFQKFGRNEIGVKHYSTMPESIQWYLKLNPSSVMDDISLLKKSVQKFG